MSDLLIFLDLFWSPEWHLFLEGLFRKSGVPSPKSRGAAKGNGTVAFHFEGWNFSAVLKRIFFNYFQNSSVCNVYQILSDSCIEKPRL